MAVVASSVPARSPDAAGLKPVGLRPVKLLAVAGDIDATIADIRLATPLRALAAGSGHALRLHSLHEVTAADLDWADVLVLQRPTTERAWKLQQRMQRLGGQVVVEIDDLLTRVDPRLDHAAVLMAQCGVVQRCLQGADAVAVSTRRLGQALGLALRHWQVVPNCAWPGALDVVVLPPAALVLSLKPAAVALVFAASDRLDLAPVTVALRQMLAERPDGLRLIGVGRAADALAAAGLPSERLAQMPRAEFLGWLRQLPCALAVMPLEDNEFNACKSAIKYFDCAVAGVPVLCSDVSPYREVLEDGMTGALVANSDAAWTAVLRRALSDAAWRQRMAQGAERDVHARFTLAHSVDAWAALLQALPPPSASRPGAGASPWWERVALALRQANRARLARRSAARLAARPAAPRRGQGR